MNWFFGKMSKVETLFYAGQIGSLMILYHASWPADDYMFDSCSGKTSQFSDSQYILIYHLHGTQQIDVDAEVCPLLCLAYDQFNPRCNFTPKFTVGVPYYSTIPF
jgi:hypothetical protein